jgi:hypothetical protein
MNTTTGLFQTLVAETVTAAQHLKFSNAMLDVIFMDYQPISASPYQTLNVNIPTVAEGDVSDIGGGPLTPTDTLHDSTSIVLDKHPSTSFVIKNWDDIRTPEDLRTKYVQPRLEALLRKCNRYVVELLTAANFNTPDAGAGADLFQRADFATCWRNLAEAGVPVEDAGNIFFVTTPKAYALTVADSNFMQESIVGVEAAMAAQQRAMIAPQFNARVRWDQQVTNINSGKELGVFLHRNAIAMVTVPPPSNQGQGAPVEEAVVFPRPSLPVQVQYGYSLKDQGWVVHLHAMLGVKVIRSNHARLVETA